MKKGITDKIIGIARSDSFRENPCFYLYDLSDVSEKASLLEASLPESVSVYYAMKANPNPDLLRHISGLRAIAGVEIASAGELELAENHFRSHRTIFSGPGKKDFELEAAISSGIKYINVESFTEAARIDRVVGSLGCGPQDVLVRVNVRYHQEGTHTKMSGFSSKLGIDEAVIADEMRRISSLSGLNVRGIHVFAGSGMLAKESVLGYFDYVMALAGRLEQGGLTMECIDMGGGFGIDYEGKGRLLDVAGIGEGLQSLVSRHGMEDKAFMLELGRYLVGESGYYVAEIIDIKESCKKKHIITSGGINHQRRPCATETNHPVEIIGMGREPLYHGQPSVRKEIVDIDGPLCLTDDILGKDVYLTKAEIGDLVVVRQSGAYGFSMAAINFLSHRTPDEYILR